MQEMPLPSRIITLQNMLRAKDEEMELLAMKWETQDQAVNLLAEEQHKTMVKVTELERQRDEYFKEITDKKREISDLLIAIKQVEEAGGSSQGGTPTDWTTRDTRDRSKSNDSLGSSNGDSIGASTVLAEQLQRKIREVEQMKIASKDMIDREFVSALMFQFLDAEEPMRSEVGKILGSSLGWSPEIRQRLEIF